MQNRGASATKPVSPMHGSTSNQMQLGGENYVEVDHMFKEYKEMHDEMVREASSHKRGSFGGSTNSRVVEHSPVKVSYLSKMARDVLAIPISTVASEATFSAGGRVIDPYRSALKSNTVEMLLCGGD
ncbi:zinc finger BED domain-containing protein RICESLEEPER 2-like protein [Tanacetum coccineum]